MNQDRCLFIEPVVECDSIVRLTINQITNSRQIINIIWGMDSLNLHQLRILAAVVEHGSFAGAAQSLDLTQPAVSAQIRHLKSFAGAPIFVRDGRGVALTEAGRALYHYAQDMLGATEALSRNLAEIESGEQDRFAVGGSLAYATYVLPTALAPFQHLHSNVWISIVDGSSREMIERVRTGALDAAVVNSSRVPSPLRELLSPTPIGNDDVVVIEAAGAPFSDGRQVRLPKLARVPFVRISGRQSLASTLDPLLAGAGREPVRTVMELGTWEGLKDAVRLGLGAAMVFRSVVMRELNRGELRVMDVDGFSEERELTLICSPQRRKERMTSAFRELLEHLREHVPAVLSQRGAEPGRRLRHG
jgi:LysR family transcriptional regulator, low CO2-responsive transcriptional regulator